MVAIASHQSLCPAQTPLPFTGGGGGTSQGPPALGVLAGLASLEPCWDLMGFTHQSVPVYLLPSCVPEAPALPFSPLNLPSLGHQAQLQGIVVLKDSWCAMPGTR